MDTEPSTLWMKSPILILLTARYAGKYKEPNTLPPKTNKFLRAITIINIPAITTLLMYIL
ncbi:hypothetical protein D3C76_1770500 [compost metagenome]